MNKLIVFRLSIKKRVDIVAVFNNKILFRLVVAHSIQYQTAINTVKNWRLKI